jgi:acyl transferase domain-containing protein
LRGGSAEHPSVFALCGKDPGELAGRLEVIADGAAALSAADLHGLARQLALDVLWADDRAGPGHGGGEDAGSGNGGSGNGGSGNGGSGNGRSEHGRSRHGRSGHAGAVRVALTAATAAQLAARARSAARLLAADVLPTAADPDVHVSTGAAGRVVVLFGGLARPGLSQAAQLVASLAGLRTLDWMGVTPGAAVGYSLGEITGLVWAGCLPAAEAARLVAQCGQVLRGCASGPAAMARVAADAETTRSLGAADRLHIAAYEGTRSHVLAGSTTGIRNLTRRAAAAGVAVEVLGITHALHSPALAGCAAPIRSVLAGTRFAPPRRRLISTVTGRPVMPGEDLTELLAGLLSQPVLFGPAMALAAEQADLIVTAGVDDGLADLAAACCAVPCVAVPHVTVPGLGGASAGACPDDNAGADAGAYAAATARAVAALFAAGAISDVGQLAPVEPWTVPRTRDSESTRRRTTASFG